MLEERKTFRSLPLHNSKEFSTSSRWHNSVSKYVRASKRLHYLPIIIYVSCLLVRNKVKLSTRENAVRKARWGENIIDNLIFQVPRWRRSVLKMSIKFLALRPAEHYFTKIWQKIVALISKPKCWWWKYLLYKYLRESWTIIECLRPWVVLAHLST
jgi:hypothetical protein